LLPLDLSDTSVERAFRPSPPGSGPGSALGAAAAAAAAGGVKSSGVTVGTHSRVNSSALDDL
jgi:hypothetical protein